MGGVDFEKLYKSMLTRKHYILKLNLGLKIIKIEQACSSNDKRLLVYENKIN